MTYILPSHRQTFPLRQMTDDIAHVDLAANVSCRDDNYNEVDLRFDRDDQTAWCYLRPSSRPSFTEPLLRELHIVQSLLEDPVQTQEVFGSADLKYFVLASRSPGLFSLGGDLELFNKLIRERNRTALRHYAYSCVEIGFRNSRGYKRGVITIGLAQGDALGGGFEGLLSCDLIFAERRARFGLPEVLFSLFPGMGAHSFLTRRLGAAQADRLIRSGKVYTAEELHALGLIEAVVEDGEGERAVVDYIRRNTARHTAHSAMFKALRRTNPLTIEELRDIADIWVETALQLTEQDLRRMGHLAAAQDRNRQRAAAAVPAIAAE